MHSLFICISVHSSGISAFRSNQKSCHSYSSAQINAAVLTTCVQKTNFQIIFVSELSICVLQIFDHSHALDPGFAHLFTQPCANWLICLLMVDYAFHNFLIRSLPYGVWPFHLSLHSPTAHPPASLHSLSHHGPPSPRIHPSEAKSAAKLLLSNSHKTI